MSGDWCEAFRGYPGKKAYQLKEGDFLQYRAYSEKKLGQILGQSLPMAFAQ